MLRHPCCGTALGLELLGFLQQAAVLQAGLAQLLLTSMILGVYVFGTKIGSNPFVLIRELPENLGLTGMGLGV